MLLRFVAPAPNAQQQHFTLLSSIRVHHFDVLLGPSDAQVLVRDRPCSRVSFCQQSVASVPVCWRVLICGRRVRTVRRMCRCMRMVRRRLRRILSTGARLASTPVSIHARLSGSHLVSARGCVGGMTSNICSIFSFADVIALHLPFAFTSSLGSPRSVGNLRMICLSH